MSVKKKQAMQETGRWLRVGTLMLTTLGPAINLLTERLRAQKDSTKTNSGQDVRNNFTNALPFDAPEKLQNVGAALTDVLAQLREYPYSQELRQRGGHLTDELQERWNGLSHDVSRRSMRLGKSAQKNMRIWQKRQDEQEQRKWVFLGFGVGISIATITTVLFLRRRQKQSDDVIPIQLYNGVVNHNGTEYKKGTQQAEVARAKTSPQEVKQVVSTPGVALADTQSEERKADVPTDAVLVGVVSTMRYYPVETPLDQLPIVHSQALDLIYFVSEDEAKAHGFTAAE